MIHQHRKIRNQKQHNQLVVVLMHHLNFLAALPISQILIRLEFCKMLLILMVVNILHQLPNQSSTQKTRQQDG